MQILTTIPYNEWHWSRAWLETVLDKTDTAQIIVYNQIINHQPMQHNRLVWWDMQQHVDQYESLREEINQRMDRALSDAARMRVWHIWRSWQRDMAVADFMQRSPYEFVWIQSTAWPEYSLPHDYVHHQLHHNDCVLWNHQGHQRTDLMLLGGSPALRQLTAERIQSHYATGIQWINQNPDVGWSVWLQDWQRRVIEGDDGYQFY